MDLPDWAIVQPAFEFLRTRPLISYSLEDIAGKRVLIINIQKSSTPILVEDNLHFIRKGTKTELVKPPVNQIKEDEGKYPNTNKVRQLIAELRQSKQQGTESKINLLEHFTALFNLTVHLKFIFYDEK